MKVTLGLDTRLFVPGRGYFRCTSETGQPGSLPRKAEALRLLRGLIERVVVRPNPKNRSFEIELVGEIANMVALFPGAENAGKEPCRTQFGKGGSGRGI